MNYLEIPAVIFLKNFMIFALPPPENHHSFRAPTV